MFVEWTNITKCSPIFILQKAFHLDRPSLVADEAIDDSLFFHKVFYKIILFVFQIIFSFNLHFFIFSFYVLLFSNNNNSF